LRSIHRWPRGGPLAHGDPVRTGSMPATSTGAGRPGPSRASMRPRCLRHAG